MCVLINLLSLWFIADSLALAQSSLIVTSAFVLVLLVKRPFIALWENLIEASQNVLQLIGVSLSLVVDVGEDARQALMFFNLVAMCCFIAFNVWRFLLVIAEAVESCNAPCARARLRVGGCLRTAARKAVSACVQRAARLVRVHVQGLLNSDDLVKAIEHSRLGAQEARHDGATLLVPACNIAALRSDTRDMMQHTTVANTAQWKRRIACWRTHCRRCAPQAPAQALPAKHEEAQALGARQWWHSDRRR